MINVNFNLRSPSQKVSPLRIILRYDNQRYYYAIKERIEKAFWDSKNQKAKKTYDGHMEFNTRLNNIRTKIENAYRLFLNDNDQRIPSKEELINALDIAFEKTQSPASRQTVKSFIEQFIVAAKTRSNHKTGKPISPNTIKTYNTFLKHFSDFENRSRKALRFDMIDAEFYDDFTNYLTSEVKLSTNAIGKNFQILKAILNDAAERGLNKSQAFKSKRFKVIREESDSIYLTETEIEALYRFDLSDRKTYEQVRDLFVVGCYTGLRYSDYSNIKPQNITADNCINIRMAKTDDKVRVPILPIVKEILKKYDGVLPVGISIQKANEYLKEITKQIPEFNQVVGKSITKAGKRIELSKHKWELVTTHAARRSFATNHYLKEFPVLAIMAITGHKTEKSFRKYIKITQFEQVSHFNKIAQKQNLKAV